MSDSSGIKIHELQDGTVHFTTDYSLFKLKSDNRDIDEKHKRKILGSISDVGYIPAPIVVNEKYEIIDGQHRWSVMKGLGIPIAYIVVPNIGIRECRMMNISGVIWKDEDWIKSYADSGYESYERLRKLLYDEYPGQFKLTNVLMATVGKPSDSATIRNGSIMVTEESMDEAYRLLGYVSNINRGIYGTNLPAKLVNAIIFVSQLSNVDTDKLARVVENGYSKAIKFSDLYDCLEWLSDLYNFGVSRNIPRVHFENDYEEAVGNKSSWYAVKWGWVESAQSRDDDATTLEYQERMDFDA